jgi:hypothetical protein
MLAEEAVDLELAALSEEVRREVQALTYGSLDAVRPR